MTKTKLTSVIDPNKTIKQSNRLIEAKYKLTSQEQKLVIAICSQLDKNAANFDTIRIKVADFANFCNIKSTNKYAEVRRIVMRLLDRKLLIHKADGGWYGTHWLQSAEYIPAESVIEYKIDERLKPELLQLKAAYLDTAAQPLMEFKCDYSARIYFLLKKMLKIKEFEYDLDFIRERFQLSKSYQIFFNLKNKVIEPAITEINEKSDIQVKHGYIKQGRSYTKIHFTVTLKKEPSREEILEHEYGQQRLIEQVSDDVQEITDKLIRRGVDVKRAKDFAKKYNKERIINNLNYALAAKDTASNLPGLILHCIKEDTAGQIAQEKKAIAERDKAKQADKQQAKEFFEKMTDEQQNLGKRKIAELMKKLKDNTPSEPIANESPKKKIKSTTIDSELKKAQNRYWKILEETGDNTNSSDTPDSVAKMTMTELLESADCLRDNHANCGGLDKGYEGYEYESKAMKKYERFIKRFKKNE